MKSEGQEMLAVIKGWARRGGGEDSLAMAEKESGKAFYKFISRPASLILCTFFIRFKTNIYNKWPVSSLEFLCPIELGCTCGFCQYQSKN